MEETKEYCDICGKEKQSDSWESQLKPMKLEVYTSCTNPLGEYCGQYQNGFLGFDDTCDTCRRVFAQNIIDTYKELSEQRQ